MTKKIRVLALTALSLAVVSCSETATTLVSEPARGISPFAAAFDFGSGSLSGSSFQQFSQSTNFTLTADGGTFTVLGKYKIAFPPNSVCDPAVSTYGPTEWDRPCQTLQGRSLNVHAVLSSSGGMAIDFSPPLRFSPNTVVTISTDIFAPFLVGNAAYYLAHPSALNYLAIYYSPALGAGQMSDFGSDLSVLTHVDLASGRVWRRIKHFSGYFMSSGQACTPSPDVPDCVYVENDIH